MGETLRARSRLSISKAGWLVGWLAGWLVGWLMVMMMDGIYQCASLGGNMLLR